ncbi:hypothetical protein ACWDZ8_45130 [Streptomyces sp. NPDC003233]
MQHRVVRVTLESDGRELPAHPHVERVVQEQIRQHGRHRGALRRSSFPFQAGCRRAVAEARRAIAVHTNSPRRRRCVLPLP